MDTNDIQIQLPASKSLSNRWLVLNFLHGGVYQLRGLSPSSDTQLLRQLLKRVPHRIASEQITDKQASFHSKVPAEVFDCGNAGSVARFLMVLLSVTEGSYVITGDERLRQRPMAQLIEAISSMGLHVQSIEEEGFLPVLVTGSLPRRKMAYIDPVQSSQFVSALMLAAPELPEGMSIMLTDRPSSRPYIEMTRSILADLGIDVSLSSNGRVYYVSPRPSVMRRRAVTLEADWSAASYFYACVALVPALRIRMRGLSLNSYQGDRIVAEIFEQMGVVSHEVRSPYKNTSGSVAISNAGCKVKRILKFNFIDCPDLFPTVAVACAALGINAFLRGIANLHLKESDRVLSVYNELTKMGCRIKLTETEMHIFPSLLAPTAPVATYNDHRIAMAFAPLMLLFPDLKIENSDVVAKSFPGFWTQFKRVKGHKSSVKSNRVSHNCLQDEKR